MCLHTNTIVYIDIGNRESHNITNDNPKFVNTVIK